MAVHFCISHSYINKNEKKREGEGTMEIKNRTWLKNLICFVTSIFITLFVVLPDIGELIHMYNTRDAQFTINAGLKVVVFIFAFIFVSRIIETITTIIYAVKRIQAKRSQGYNIWDVNTFKKDTSSKLNGGIDDENKWDFTK